MIETNTGQQIETERQLSGVMTTLVACIEDELRITTDEATRLRLREHIDSFKSRHFDRDSVREGIDAEMAEAALPHIESKLQRHSNTLRSVKRALFVTDKGFEWHTVTDSHGLTTLYAALTELDPQHIAARPWCELRSDTQTVVESAETHLIEEVKNAARQIRQNVPFEKKAKIGFLGRFVASKIDPSGANEAFRARVREERAALLEQGFEQLHFLLQHAEALLVERAFDKMPTNGKAYVELCNTVVDEYVAWSNSEVWTPSSVSTRAERMAAWLAEHDAETAVTVVSEPSLIPQEDIQLETTQEPQNETREVVTVPVRAQELPWLENIEDAQIELLDGHDTPIYIVRALAKKVAQLSRISRESFAGSAQGTNKFDIALTQQARRLAKGIMPYQDANSVKRLKVKQADLRPEYKGNSYWYTFDITPNAPRVYFTVKKATDVLAGNAEQDALALVVVGESDKQRQIDLLTRFSTLSRTYLRNNGAGSI